MFTTLKQRLILGIFVFIILSIPIGAYVISEQQSKSPEVASSNEGDRTISTFSQPVTSAKPTSTPQKLDLASLIDETTQDEEETIPSATTAPTIASAFGPTLEFLITLEGRPLSNQATQLFVGISDASQTTSPQYLLSFSVEVPASGAATNISLAGLTAGASYNAYIKGPAQIATSSAFTMATNRSVLNNNQALLLTTGDLNEDNTINSADYALAKAAFGTNQNSATWNANIDFNKDGVINSLDLGIVSKNLGKTGSSGVWQSTPQAGYALVQPFSSTLNTGTPSSSIKVASESAKPGYWIWVPNP